MIVIQPTSRYIRPTTLVIIAKEFQWNDKIRAVSIESFKQQVIYTFLHQTEEGIRQYHWDSNLEEVEGPE